MEDTDESTALLKELEEFIDAPVECEHRSHSDPQRAHLHDKGSASWFIVGTHKCGRTVSLYVCETFMQAGMRGRFAVNCAKCSQDVPFNDYYSIRTQVS